jgi:hypothetical protein
MVKVVAAYRRQVDGTGRLSCWTRDRSGSRRLLHQVWRSASRPYCGTTFSNLLDACEEMAFAQHVSRLRAGVNTARHETYRHLLARGFRTDIQGVVKSRANEAGYNRPGVYLIDDWR